MSKGENIFKRKDGRWEARYIKGREISGKIRYGFCYGKTYREAKEKAERSRAALTEGAKIPEAPGRHRFAYYCAEWLRMTGGCLKPSTRERYGTILDKHIVPKLGSCFPRELTTGLVEAFKLELLREGLSASRVKDVLTVLKLVIKYTSRLYPGLVPEISISYPREAKKEERVLTRDEQKGLAACLVDGMDCCKFGILLAMNTGIRIGELCALRWADVSLRDRTVKITGTMQRLRDTSGEGGRTKVVVGTPKSDTSARTIPLTESLTELCGRVDPKDPSAYLLTGTARYMEPRALQYRLKKYTSECGLEGVHFHTLRHTFATRCAEAGFEVKSLSELLGHSTATITLNKYVHSSLDMKRRDLEKLTMAEL